MELLLHADVCIETHLQMENESRVPLQWQSLFGIQHAYWLAPNAICLCLACAVLMSVTIVTCPQLFQFASLTHMEEFVSYLSNIYFALGPYIQFQVFYCACILQKTKQRTC